MSRFLKRRQGWDLAYIRRYLGSVGRRGLPDAASIALKICFLCQMHLISDHTRQDSHAVRTLEQKEEDDDLLSHSFRISNNAELSLWPGHCDI